MNKLFLTPVIQNSPMYHAAISKCMPTVNYKNGRNVESWHQKKITDRLLEQGFEVTKVIVASKSSTSDLIACAPDGRFWRIEVKRPTDRITAAQEIKLYNSWQRNAVVMCASGIADFEAKFKMLLGEIEVPKCDELPKGPTI